MLLVWPGLLEAKKVMRELCRDREKIDGLLESQASLHRTQLGTTRVPPLDKSNFRGNLSVNWVPFILLLAWLVAIGARLQLGPA